MTPIELQLQLQTVREAAESQQREADDTISSLRADLIASSAEAGEWVTNP